MKEQKIPYGQIVGFESLEEILAYMDAQEQQAIERTIEEQWEISWGARVFRMVEDLAIWGHIFSQQEFLDANVEPGKTPDQETLDELDGLRASYLSGYRYGIWYSEVEPQGEYGSAHVSTLWEITLNDFEAAQRNSWRLWSEFTNRVGREIRDAHEAHNHEGKESDEDAR